MLLGLIDRPTGDLDVIALRPGGTFQKVEALPEALDTAVRQVGAALGLADRWLNTGPSSLMDFGLPSGWEGRLTTRRFGAISVHLASRQDQICLKLYAAVDRGPDDKHYRDLQTLDPTREELVFAGNWAGNVNPMRPHCDDQSWPHPWARCIGVRHAMSRAVTSRFIS